MWLTATQLAAELGVSARTIKEHALKLERAGIRCTTMMGRPKLYNREIISEYQYGRRDENVKEGNIVRLDDLANRPDSARDSWSS